MDEVIKALNIHLDNLLEAALIGKMTPTDAITFVRHHTRTAINLAIQQRLASWNQEKLADLHKTLST